MNTSKIIKAYIGTGTYSTTEPITQGDYGYILQIEGAELPATYRVDFSNNRHEGEALPVYGNENGAEVPKELIDTGKDVYAFYYYIEENFGKTAYTWKIPNDTRAKNGNRVPTPTQQDSIDQLIVRSNEAVESAEQSAEDASASAQNASADAEMAEEARTDAQNFANNAQASATSASQSATASANSATASAQSASQSAQINADVEDMVDDAQGYAESASQSASASAQSASDAQGYAQSASASVQSASGYATQADISANTASTKASEASQSATTASQKATESAQSASQALTYKTDAESAKTASQTAQGLAESARDNAIQAKEDAESVRDEAQSLVDGISGKVEQIDSNTERIESLEDDRYKPYVTDSASGSIASFPDGADNIPLKSLVVDINPVQDLHGYDSPWPAGGGKNLIYKTLKGVNIGADGKITSYNAYDVFCAKVESGKTYTISINGVATRSVDVGYFAEDPVLRSTTYDGNRILNLQATFEATYTGFIGFRFDADTANVQLEEGSTPTAWSPYENICPISGWTEINAYNDPVHGGNIEWNQLTQTIDADYANKWVSSPPNYSTITVNDDTIVCTMSDDIMQVNLINNGQKKRLVVGHKYLYSVKVKSDAWASSGNKLIIIFDGYWVRTFYPTDNVPTGKWFEVSGIWTSTVANELQPTVRKYRDENNYPFEVKQYMIFDLTNIFGAGNEPSTVEEFKALFPNDYYDYNDGEKTTASAVNNKPYTHVNIQLGQTVYGGHLDVLSGVLTVDRAMVDLGTLTWGYTGKIFYSASAPLFGANGTALLSNAAGNVCEIYKYAAVTINNPVNGRFFISNTQKVPVLRVSDNRFTDAVSLKSALDGIKAVFELYAPLTIQLTPNQVNSLLGANNIWADTGDCAVEYRADTRLYIEKLTQPEEDDMIANSAIASGQFFMIGNTLYRALANIASGATITIGTNAQRVSLSDALNLVNA